MTDLGCTVTTQIISQSDVERGFGKGIICLGGYTTDLFYMSLIKVFFCPLNPLESPKKLFSRIKAGAGRLGKLFLASFRSFTVRKITQLLHN